jgi:hypothetical protein
MRSEEILKRAGEGMKESNKILIRELVRDLEEKNIPVVISDNGKVQKLVRPQNISEKELKDFEKELKKFGFNKSQFCLLESRPSRLSSKTKKGDVVIIYKESAKVKKYRTQNKTSWISVLHHDLENKFFN